VFVGASVNNMFVYSQAKNENIKKIKKIIKIMLLLCAYIINVIKAPYFLRLINYSSFVLSRRVAPKNSEK